MNAKPATTVNEAQFPETARFLAWYDAEKKRGLVDVKFCTADVYEATSEEFFAEVNRAIAAKTVDDPELI